MISVILPTIRPHKIYTALENLAASTTEVFEAIVVADFPIPVDLPKMSLLAWMQQPRRGTVDAINLGYESSQGEYVFLMNDEASLSPGSLEHLRRAVEDDPYQLVTPRHKPSFPFVYYGLPFAPFPFAHRDLYEEVGGLFLDKYRCFYADPDLSLRVHERGFPVWVVEEAVVHHRNRHDEAHHQNVSRWFNADQATFRARWDHLGEFRDP